MSASSEIRPVTRRDENGIAVVTIDSPPVNVLSAQVRHGLIEAFASISADPAVEAVVLICGGRTFIAGFDITEFQTGLKEPPLAQVLELVENVGKPTIAAIHGTALGGGLEIAFLCSHRIAVPSAKVGLPEVHLGLLPGAGGTQRLPRIVGPEIALELLTSGRHVSAPEALELGIIDALAAEGSLEQEAFAFARRILAEKRPVPRVRDRQDLIEPYRGKSELFSEFRGRNASAFRGFKAPEAIIRAVEAAVERPFDEGIQREQELIYELLKTPESAAQRYVFFAERQTAKIPDVPAGAETYPIRNVGVIGVGAMGGAIAMNFLDAGIPVILVELDQASLDSRISAIRRDYEDGPTRRLTGEMVEQRMALIETSTDLVSLADVDLVIEAVSDEMGVATDVFAKLDKIARAGSILASSASLLDIDEIAAATSRPEWVIGLHFSSKGARLLEVVRGATTAQAVIATAMGLARTIDKAPVLSRASHGFMANRIMRACRAEAEALVREGGSPHDIDKAMFDYGFPMGHFGMTNLVGLDVVARETGEQSAQEIVARLLYPAVNEAAKVLEEGVAIRASDIDVAAILGYDWPVYTGGPMFWADTVGLPKILAWLKAAEAEHGERFKPAKLLETLAGQGKRFTG